MQHLLTPREQAAMAALLEHHYGDGFVYAAGSEQRLLLAQARALGLVSEDGFLTPAGHAFLAEHRSAALRTPESQTTGQD